jgi:hypothetical protein
MMVTFRRSELQSLKLILEDYKNLNGQMQFYRWFQYLDRKIWESARKPRRVKVGR